MKGSLCVFILFFWGFTALSQHVRGTIKDEEGNVLPFASITIKNSGSGTTANNHGAYDIQLAPGAYTIECRHVGYYPSEKTIRLGREDTVVNFQLSLHQFKMNEIVISGKDPALSIMQKAIAKRAFYEKQAAAFSAKVYIKDLIQLVELPDRIMGKKISEEDKQDMALDSSGSGIIYLSEAVTKVGVKPKDKIKLEVLSSRVSGSKGFGFDFPIFINFYHENVMAMTDQINARGFISPLAENAFHYYQFRYLGSFMDNGKKIFSIKVFPKRQYEPLFTGVLNIAKEGYRIYSCRLYLTPYAQLEVLDTLEITQLHLPVKDELWKVKNQVLHFHFDKLGIEAVGNFVNIYMDYDLSPNFPPDYFNNVIIKYDSAANKKSKTYWDSVRPVPLEPEELEDYKTKDSAMEAQQQLSLDSLRKKQGPISLTDVLLFDVDRIHYAKKGQFRWELDGLLKTLEYNTVEGLAINPSLVISKPVNKGKARLNFIADMRYGFHNKHINPWAGFTLNRSGRHNENSAHLSSEWMIAGGKRVSQFFKMSAIDGLGNSIGALLYGRNDMKIYENYFAKAGYKKQLSNGWHLMVRGEFENRLPLYNTTDFILNKKHLDRFTPNYPIEILDTQFTRHQAVLFNAKLSYQPGQKYIQYPNFRASLGSQQPVFSFNYTKGISNILGSDVNYDKWRFNVIDDINFKIGGLLKYNISVGGFLNDAQVYAQDYRHYWANDSKVAQEYVTSFQNATQYELSNTDAFYGEVHLEHHSNGLMTNKIPLLRKWNWFLVEGTNVLLTSGDTRYMELFVGLENIFKIVRVDMLVGFQNGYRPVYTWRIGFGGTLGDALNTIRFAGFKKIIDRW